jgi:hypothetical protein
MIETLEHMELINTADLRNALGNLYCVLFLLTYIP